MFKMMRGFGFWILFMVVGTIFMFHSFSTNTETGRSSFPDIIFAGCEIGNMVTTHNRKLKEAIKSYKLNSNAKKSASSTNFNMEDYPRIDPAPSSKANIHAGPIEHGSPLMPYIPKPTPPSPVHPKHNGTGSPLSPNNNHQ
ncbi:hypothetical protein MKX03_002528 [Papaver bracteatum]|nr:hypothetical protein MKX03_002528 [Papaver bracteatum]